MPKGVKHLSFEGVGSQIFDEILIVGCFCKVVLGRVRLEGPANSRASMSFQCSCLI